MDVCDAESHRLLHLSVQCRAIPEAACIPLLSDVLRQAHGPELVECWELASLEVYGLLLIYQNVPSLKCVHKDALNLRRIERRPDDRRYEHILASGLDKPCGQHRRNQAVSLREMKEMVQACSHALVHEKSYVLRQVFMELFPAK